MLWHYNEKSYRIKYVLMPNFEDLLLSPEWFDNKFYHYDKIAIYQNKNRI